MTMAKARAVRPPMVTKYKSLPTDYDGQRYPSKAEAAHAKHLDELKSRGEIRWWVRQVRFRLGVAENSFVVDFVVCDADGNVVAVEVKGKETPKFKNDRRLWARFGPIPLHIIKGGRVAEIVEVYDSTVN